MQDIVANLRLFKILDPVVPFYGTTGVIHRIYRLHPIRLLIVFAVRNVALHTIHKIAELEKDRRNKFTLFGTLFGIQSQNGTAFH